MRTRKKTIKWNILCVYIYVIEISFSIHYTLKYGVIVLQFCYLEKRFMHCTCIETPVFEVLWNLCRALWIYRLNQILDAVAVENSFIQHIFIFWFDITLSKMIYKILVYLIVLHRNDSFDFYSLQWFQSILLNRFKTILLLSIIISNGLKRKCGIICIKLEFTKSQSILSSNIISIRLTSRSFQYQTIVKYI